MALQESTAVRNAKLDAIENTIGTSPLLVFFTGGQPADCASADTGAVLATITLPSDWMSAASGGVKSLLGTWQTTASATGILGYWRIKDSGGSVCHMQGSVTANGGGGQITVPNTSIASGQQFTITSFTLTDGNP